VYHSHLTDAATKSGRSADINGILQPVRDALRQQRHEVISRFVEVDTDHDEQLSFKDVLRLVAMFVPGRKVPGR
jgi:hypothetical protein